jgi:dTDP-glucose 4,6-dehydratase
MKKVIVTGGLGFIGSNLINILKNNYFVINIDKVSYASNFSNINSKKNYAFYKQDINNKLFLKNILKSTILLLFLILQQKLMSTDLLMDPNNL